VAQAMRPDAKTSLDFNEAVDDGFGMQWHQLDYLQSIRTSHQTDNHINTHTHTCLTALFWDYPGEPTPER